MVLAEVAVPLLALFGLLCLVTGGEAFNHLVPYTAAADYEWDRMGRAYRDFVTLIGPLVALILPAVVALGALAMRGPFATYLVYWLLNLVGLVTISKAGAAQNYFIEPYLATLVLAALLAGTGGPGGHRRGPRLARLPAGGGPGRDLRGHGAGPVPAASPGAAGAGRALRPRPGHERSRSSPRT